MCVYLHLGPVFHKSNMEFSVFYFLPLLVNACVGIRNVNEAWNIVKRSVRVNKIPFHLFGGRVALEDCVLHKSLYIAQINLNEVRTQPILLLLDAKQKAKTNWKSKTNETAHNAFIVIGKSCSDGSKQHIATESGGGREEHFWEH